MKYVQRLAFVVAVLVALSVPAPGTLQAQFCAASATTSCTSSCNADQIPSCPTLCSQQCNMPYIDGTRSDSCGNGQGCDLGQFRVERQCSCGTPPPSCTPDGGSCTHPSDCCNNDCVYSMCWGTPILIDLQSNNSNYHLTSPADGVQFDLSANGIPVQVGWTQPEGQVGFLAIDRNDNHLIDDGSELFGTSFRKSDGSRAANGFDALEDIDRSGGTPDGRVDANDAAYSQIIVWLDRNHDGQSQRAELLSLREARITALFTQYEEILRVDRNGNKYRYIGSALLHRRGKEFPRKLTDVILAHE
jgi:hypothetical protein